MIFGIERSFRPIVWLGAMLSLLCRGEIAAGEPLSRALGDAITIHGGVTCIDEEALLAQVRSWLDADTVEGDLRVDVRGSDRDPRFVSFRIWRGDRLIAQRSFAPGPAQCGQMHAVLGLSIALALKVSLRDELLGPPVPRPTGKWSMGIGAAVGWNVMPGLSGGGVLWGERSFPERFSLHLELSGLSGWDERFEGVSGEFATPSFATQAAACALPTFAEGVTGRFCVGLEGRVLFASGSGFAVSKEAVLGWLSIANSAGVSVGLTPRWSFVGSVGLTMPLERVQLAVVDPGGRVVATRDLAPAGGLLSIGMAYEF